MEKIFFGVFEKFLLENHPDDFRQMKRYVGGIYEKGDDEDACTEAVWDALADTSIPKNFFLFLKEKEGWEQNEEDEEDGEDGEDEGAELEEDMEYISPA